VSATAAAVAGTVREALAAAAERLTAAGCDTPGLDAAVLLSHALGLPEDLILEPRAPLSEADARRFAELVDRRARREPVAYIVGSKGFRRLEIAVDRRVLVPRPETELLVEVAVEVAPRGGQVHDVGTGSGAVALALKHERSDLVVSGSDASADAVDVACANAERLGLEVAFAVARGLPEGERFGLVVANLPYVAEDEYRSLAPEIRDHEPREALVGGPDGLDEIRGLVAGAPSGTPLALEHAPGQAAAVRELLAAGAETRRDLAGRERVTLGRAP
jgi:release factor glutamine methyltransferase